MPNNHLHRSPLERWGANVIVAGLVLLFVQLALEYAVQFAMLARWGTADEYFTWKPTGSFSVGLLVVLVGAAMLAFRQIAPRDERAEQPKQAAGEHPAPAGP